MTACGDNAPSEEQLREARQEGAQAARIKELERKVRQQERRRDGGATPPRSSSPGGSSGSASKTSCGGDLSVGPNTSCPFAESVRSSYPGSEAPFEVYSSVTGQTYTMRCTSGSPHVCTGGNNASVYFP